MLTDKQKIEQVEAKLDGTSQELFVEIKVMRVDGTVMLKYTTNALNSFLWAAKTPDDGILGPGRILVEFAYQPFTKEI